MTITWRGREVHQDEFERLVYAALNTVRWKLWIRDAGRFGIEDLQGAVETIAGEVELYT